MVGFLVAETASRIFVMSPTENNHAVSRWSLLLLLAFAAKQKQQRLYRYDAETLLVVL